MHKKNYSALCLKQKFVIYTCKYHFSCLKMKLKTNCFASVKVTLGDTTLKFFLGFEDIQVIFMALVAYILYLDIKGRHIFLGFYEALKGTSKVSRKIIKAWGPCFRVVSHLFNCFCKL